MFFILFAKIVQNERKTKRKTIFLMFFRIAAYLRPFSKGQSTNNRAKNQIKKLLFLFSNEGTFETQSQS